VPEYEITAVAHNDDGTLKTRPWGDGMLEYKMHVRDGEGNLTQSVEWSRKTGSPPPTVGQKIIGAIEQGKYGPKFKQQGGGGGGGGGYGKPRDPAERRSIAMQHAQKCAVTILEVAAAHGDYKPPNAGDVVSQVRTVAAKLFLQVKDAEDDKITATP
jgi:hypothetical protein